MTPRLAVSRLLAGLVVAVILAAAAPATADDATGKGVTETPIFSRKLPNAAGKTMTVVSVDYAPGGASAPHRHAPSAVVFAYVVAGAIRSQVEGAGEARVYHVGDTWYEPPNAHHLVSENASTTEPARLIAVVIADDGASITTFDGAN
jgi:quercetin dioxygenase-like cupin family protein